MLQVMQTIKQNEKKYVPLTQFQKQKITYCDFIHIKNPEWVNDDEGKLISDCKQVGI